MQRPPLLVTEDHPRQPKGVLYSDAPRDRLEDASPTEVDPFAEPAALRALLDGGPIGGGPNPADLDEGEPPKARGRKPRGKGGSRF